MGKIKKIKNKIRKSLGFSKEYFKSIELMSVKMRLNDKNKIIYWLGLRRNHDMQTSGIPISEKNYNLLVKYSDLLCKRRALFFDNLTPHQYYLHLLYMKYFKINYEENKPANRRARSYPLDITELFINLHKGLKEIEAQIKKG